MTRQDFVPDMTMLHDAVHGPIRLDGSHPDAARVLVTLARSTELARLRRIKQLGLAAFAFPAADHSRYAHALGTAHVMRQLVDGPLASHLERLDREQLVTAFPELGDRLTDSVPALVALHLQVAALVQDVGELPYANATYRLLEAGASVRSDVARYLPNHDMTDAKELFTARFVCASEAMSSVDDVIDRQFLLYLLFGRSGTARVPEDVVSLRHLLDGVVDADRLDYVYRDAHHTVGHVGGPQAIVDAIDHVDSAGPVFKEPGPVLDFVSTRSLVWSRVYFEAQNRFRITLLRAVLRQVRADEPSRATLFADAGNGREIMYDDWLLIDDNWIQRGLERLSSNPAAKHAWAETAFGRTSWTALEEYLRPSARYVAEWLPPPTEARDRSWEAALPEDLLFDTCADYRHHRLYDGESIRITGPRFQRCDLPIPLEQCAGPLDGLLRRDWLPLAPAESVLLFLPQSRGTPEWQTFLQGIRDGVMHGHLMRCDEEQRFPLPDTRDLSSHDGPALFISHAFDDGAFVERLMFRLNLRRRRYFAIRQPSQGRGITAGENSIALVDEAEAVLVVLSANYVRQASEQPNGNISKEIQRMVERRIRDGIPIVFLSADALDEVDDSSLWARFGLDEADAPVVEPLRTAERTIIDAWVDKIVDQVDAIDGER